MLQVPLYVTMLGGKGLATTSNGATVLQLPLQYKGKIKYFNIQNLTDNTLQIFAPHADPLTAVPVYNIGSYMQITLDMSQTLSEGMKIYYSNPDIDSYNTPKSMTVYWTDESLGWSHSLQGSFPSQNVNAKIVSPLSNGKVAVEVLNNPAVSINNTPTVTVSNNPSVNVLTDVNIYTTLPMTNSATNIATNLTQAGVSGKSWYVSYIHLMVTGSASIGAANVPVALKDGTTTIFQSSIPAASPNGAAQLMSFNTPIKLTAGNSVTLSIGASGAASCSIISNMGLFQK
jgi:hypothetical protein